MRSGFGASLVERARAVIDAYEHGELEQHHIDALGEARDEHLKEEGHICGTLAEMRDALDAMNKRRLRAAAEELLEALPDIMFFDIEQLRADGDLEKLPNGGWAVVLRDQEHS